MGMFGGMALYGYATRADLTSWGTMGMMALWGMILGMIVNYFLQSPMMDLVLSGIGVLLFTALTAYDVQKLKQLGTYLLAHQQDMSKAAIMGALTLYLDFLNLFLFLLRFMGKKRND
jgi:FtsH-binding integral membrane protein